MRDNLGIPDQFDLKVCIVAHGPAHDLRNAQVEVGALSAREHPNENIFICVSGKLSAQTNITLQPLRAVWVAMSGVSKVSCQRTANLINPVKTLRPLNR
jgi:hypothetical protein